MSESVRQVNSFFRTAVRSDVDEVLDKIVLSDRQKTIFTLFYLRKLDVGFISDTIGLSPDAINKELRIIRKKIVKVITI